MRKAFRLFLFLAISLGAALFVRVTAPAIPRAKRARHRHAAQALWAKAVWRVLRLQVHVHGCCPAGGPFLVVSNHLGYLDIAILSGILPVTFVSKEEVRSWPFLGYLARTAGTIFVSREDRREATDFIERVRERLSSGENVLVFPEGTSSRGESILPFKTAAFASVSGTPHSAILPVRIDLLEVGGAPATRMLRDTACWHGDMEFVPHFWNFLASGGARFLVRIGAAVPCDSMDRKELARAARDRMIELGEATVRSRTLLPGGWTIRNGI